MKLKSTPSGNIEDIDRELARLLKLRIARLVEDSGADPAIPNEQIAPVLRSVVDGTVAAAKAIRPQAKMNEPPPRRCVVIGKRGVTGSFFADRLAAFGHDVTGFGHAGWGNEAEPLLARADLVLVSVPIDRVAEIVRRAASHMRPDAVLADVTSVKREAFAAMMDAHAGPVVGLHPMFGPGVRTFLSQIVVVSGGRGGESYRWLIDLMRADGARLVESTPAEHDRMMIAVQAARHFLTMTMGAFLTAEGVDVARSLDFASPVYRLEIDMVGRLFAQDAPLYVDIMLASPERREAIGRLAETCGELARLAKAADREGLIAAFGRTREALGRETARALAESDRVIEAFGTILAAGRSGSTPISADTDHG